MKKIFLFCCIILPVVFLSAQPNNPLAARGEEYLASVKRLTADFDNGLVKDFSEDAIRFYAGQLPLRNEVSMDMATRIIHTIKSPGFEITSFISNSAMPFTVKEVVKKLLLYSGQPAGDDYKAKLVKLTDEVKFARVPDNVREFCLFLIAVAYNNEEYQPSLRKRKGECYVSGPYGEGYEEEISCALLGAITGAWIGFEICGIFCMFGGGIIGGIVGSLS